MIGDISNRKISNNRLVKLKIVEDFIKKWNESLFIISYNFHNIEDRKIHVLKKTLKNYSLPKVFKNSLIKRGLKNSLIKDEFKLEKNNLLIFGKNNSESDIFYVLKLIKEFESEFLSIDDNQTNNFNWAFFDGKFEHSKIIKEWSLLPKKEHIFGKLVNSLSYNLIFFIECIKKINMEKGNNGILNNDVSKQQEMIENIVEKILNLNLVDLNHLTNELIKKANINLTPLSQDIAPETKKKEEASLNVSLTLSALPDDKKISFYLFIKKTIKEVSGEEIVVMKAKEMVTNSLNESIPIFPKISREIADRIIKDGEKFGAIFKIEDK